MAGLVLIRGAGDLATGVAVRLHKSGIKVLLTELSAPLAVRRRACLSEAAYEGEMCVEQVTARLLQDPSDAFKILAKHEIPLVIDPDAKAIQVIQPIAIVDARMKKSVLPREFAPSTFLIGLGPGFAAPSNSDCVVETKRGHDLGRVIWSGTAQADSGIPSGVSTRVLRAPSAGTFQSSRAIGDHVEPGTVLGTLNNHPIKAPIAGTIRGLVRTGTACAIHMKIGDIDPRDDPQLCAVISDKARAVAGGVLEALLARPAVRSKLWA